MRTDCEPHKPFGPSYIPMIICSLNSYNYYNILLNRENASTFL